MSGGVDSAVAALLAKEKNFDCIGTTMRLFDNDDIGATSERACCSLEDAKLAEQVANRLDIPFYVLNLADDFRKEVMNRFVREYKNGATPNPCIDCNRYIKFDRLYKRAAQLGMDYVVTGHYARLEVCPETGRFLLKKGADLSKDQSYVLYAMTQNQLRHTMFPLGDMTKASVRTMAAKNGFANAEKPDSQDICFVRNKDYAAFIDQYTQEICPSGDFIDKSGKILGRHKGHIRYTIGQRKGLEIAFGIPMYVCAKNPADNTVTLCEESELYSKKLYARDFNWIPFEKPDKPMRVRAKIRYAHDEEWATVQPVSGDDNARGGDKAHDGDNIRGGDRVRGGNNIRDDDRIGGGDTVCVEFDQPQRAIAKGQAVVLYDGDIVVGGGTII